MVLDDADLSREEALARLHAARERYRTYDSRFVITVEDQRTRETKVLYRPAWKQDELHACRAPNILLGGAAGGTKSHGIRWDATIKAMRIPGFRALILRRVFKQLLQTQIIKIEAEVPPELARYDRDRDQLKFPNGSIIQFGHCHREADFKAHLGPEWDAIYVDESSEFSHDWLLKLASRVRSTKPGVTAQFILGTNPGGDGHLFHLSHFIHKDYQPEAGQRYEPAEWHFIPSFVWDNPFLQDDYVDRLLSMSRAERRAYLQGDWSAFSGQYFDEWRADTHGIGLVRPPDGRLERAGGLDWGYFPSPGVALWGAFDLYGRCTVYQELVFTKTSPLALADQLARRSAGPHEREMIFRADTQMWTPNAETGVPIATAINERLAAIGSGVLLMQANKDRINGWAAVHQYLDPARLHPDGEPGPWLRVAFADARSGLGAPYLLSTIGAQRHDDKQTGDMAKSTNDHACDALRYLLISRPPLPEVERPPAPTRAERIRGRTQLLLQRAFARQNAAELELTTEGDGMDEGDPTELTTNPEEAEAMRDTLGDLWL